MQIIKTYDFQPNTELEEYLKFVANDLKISPWISPEDMVSFVDGIHSYTLHREGQFQAQLFTVEPNVIIPEHIHPNIDSFEIAIRGMTLFHSGQILLTPYDTNLIGNAVFVGHDQWHGGCACEKGGAFMSVQQWLNGIKPSSVADDWVGDIIGPLHAKNISEYESNQSSN